MRLSIRAKMVTSFVLILTFMAIVGWRGIVGMRDINQTLNSIYANDFLPARMIAEANAALISWNRATLHHVLAESIAKMDEYEQTMLEQESTLLCVASDVIRDGEPIAGRPSVSPTPLRRV